ncbi:MAG: hypothetical protein COA70_11845 [Planctomycetota bacterium]|nr:MAG: hypothetical protein COA70_11845 [Planctomycetota bacterium]
MFHAITLSLALVLQQDTPAPNPPTTVWELLQQKYDTNDDGKISPKEHERGEEAFSNLDADGDGFITQADIEAPSWGPGSRAQKRKKNMRNRRVQPPKVGEVAPDFELQVLLHEDDAVDKNVSAESKPTKRSKAKKEKPKKPETMRLSSFAGKKPVALIFGSYT